MTKICWVVEAVDGILGQKIKLTHHQIKNKILENAEIYYKVAINSIIDRMKSTNYIHKNSKIDFFKKKFVCNNWDRKMVTFQIVIFNDLLYVRELALY